MNKEKWGRRVVVGMIWAILNYGIVLLQPVLKLDVGDVKLLVEKSAWIAGIIVVGLSGTDIVGQYMNNKKPTEDK